MKNLYTTSALLCSFFCAFSSPALAADARIEGAKLCTQYIPSNERQYGIPSHLLSAISSTESGRYHEGLKIVLPWPWTINVEGKGYFFDSKAEAVAAVRKYQAQGIKSIDVGCMQVNLMHHPNAFATLDQAFDPKYNVAYAASFVRNLYEEDKNWKKAAAGYHSRTPERGNNYVNLVFKKWETIISRLRLSASDTIHKADASYDGKTLTTAPVALTQSRPVKALPEQKGQKLASQSAVHMKVINVSDMSQRRNNGLIIVKPDVPEGEVAAAEATPVTLARADVPGSIAPVQSKIIRMDRVSHKDTVTISSLSTSTKNGPRFIFSD